MAAAPETLTAVPPRETKADRTRRRILDATLEILAAKGYRNTTIADVAAASHLSRAGVQHHFADVDELVVAALHHRDGRDAHATKVTAAEESEELFDAVVTRMLLNSWTPERTRAYTILAGESVSSSHPAHEWFRQHYALVRTDIAEAIRTGVADGTLRSDADPDSVASQLVAFLEGIQILWLHDPDHIDLRATVADHVARLRRDLVLLPATRG